MVCAKGGQQFRRFCTIIAPRAFHQRDGTGQGAAFTSADFVCCGLDIHARFMKSLWLWCPDEVLRIGLFTKG
jgi:hypothetical protein